METRLRANGELREDLARLQADARLRESASLRAGGGRRNQRPAGATPRTSDGRDESRHAPRWCGVRSFSAAPANAVRGRGRRTAAGHRLLSGVCRSARVGRGRRSRPVRGRGAGTEADDPRGRRGRFLDEDQRPRPFDASSPSFPAQPIRARYSRVESVSCRLPASRRALWFAKPRRGLHGDHSGHANGNGLRVCFRPGGASHAEPLSRADPGRPLRFGGNRTLALHHAPGPAGTGICDGRGIPRRGRAPRKVASYAGGRG